MTFLWSKLRHFGKISHELLIALMLQCTLSTEIAVVKIIRSIRNLLSVNRWRPKQQPCYPTPWEKNITAQQTMTGDFPRSLASLIDQPAITTTGTMMTSINSSTSNIYPIVSIVMIYYFWLREERLPFSISLISYPAQPTLTRRISVIFTYWKIEIAQRQLAGANYAFHWLV